MTLRARLALVKRVPAGSGRVLRPRLHDRRATPRWAWCRSATATASRGAAGNVGPLQVAGRRHTIAGPGLHGPVRRRPRRPPGRRATCAPATPSSCSATGDDGRADRAGLGRGGGHHLLRDRHPDRLAGAAHVRRGRLREVAVAHGPRGRRRAGRRRRRRRARAGGRALDGWPRCRGRTSGEPYGSLRGEVHRVTADDGTALHVEVDELDVDGPPDPAGTSTVTVVFSHGFCLNQDIWHYQRQWLRGRYRLVLWDQRGHGRSRHRPGGELHRRPVRCRPARRDRRRRARPVRWCWSGTRWAA